MCSQKYVFYGFPYSMVRSEHNDLQWMLLYDAMRSEENFKTDADC